MRAAILAFALSTLAACSAPPPVGLAADVPGTSWSVERVVYADGEVVRGDGEELSFGPAGGLAVSGCNLCSGRYAMRDSVLAIDPTLSCTRRACAPGTLELEALVTGTSVLRRDGSYLVVEPDSQAVQVLLVPRR